MNTRNDLYAPAPQPTGYKPLTDTPAGCPRNPLIAALMSAVLPGFGQLYNGRVNSAIWIFLCFCLLTIPLMAIVALYLPVALTLPVLVLSLVLTLGLWLYAIVAAWRQASLSKRYRRPAWQTGGLYAAVFVVCSLIILPLLVNWVQSRQVQAFRIPSGSMQPTILAGDFLFANKNYNCPYCRKNVQRGDAAVFVYPNNRNLYYIKRIIALPGDEVEFAANGLSVNGVALSAPGEAPEAGEVIEESINGVSWRAIAGTVADGSRTVIVKPGHVFVMGDNRDHSSDSRKFGQVPLSDVVGRARQVWFSKGEDGIRWDRIGLSLVP